MKRIYLDNSATTKPAKEVIDIMAEVQEKYWGNPSSVHSFGQEARKIVDEGRRFVSFFIGCEPNEVIFTSGGSEADNLAIKGIVSVSSIQQSAFSKPHVITSAVEHHAVLHTVQELEKQGKIEATYLKPDHNGIISPEQIEEAIKDNTVLVTLIYVNNETGVVNPIREIGKMIQSYNDRILKQVQDDNKKNLNADGSMLNARKKSKIFFHTDAVQAGEFMQLAPEFLKTDLMTLSGHKLHGPKGIGVLYVKKGVKLARQISGGDHEFRLRAGTENNAAVAGLHKAFDLILKERADNFLKEEYQPYPEAMGTGDFRKIEDLRNYLEANLLKQISNSQINGDKVKRAPHISNMSFINAEGEAIILNLDMEGIAVSSGSACTSGSLDPSHVLTAMGIPAAQAHGSIRFSLSRETTKEEIDKVIEVLPGIIEKLRAMSPIK